MSIKSLFEDIADAIREKSGSSDTYTPAEMPSAIRSIPSGSSTASGVSYDNTSSGLTASNVQDAIDELSGDVATINSDLSELENPTPDIDYTATANMKGSDVLAWIRSNIDFTKITINTVLEVGGGLYRVYNSYSVTNLFGASYVATSGSGLVTAGFLTNSTDTTNNRWWINSTDYLNAIVIYSGSHLKVYY